MAKILITGPTSLIGLSLINHLLEQKHQLVLASKSLAKLSQYQSHPLVELVYWDLTDALPTSNLLEYFKNPSHLIYLAWQDLPNYHSHHHLKINYRYSSRFITKLIADGLQNITVSGTCFEYGKLEGCLSENMACQPSTIYGRSKLLLYNHLRQLKTCYSFNLKWLRIFYLAHHSSKKNDLFGFLNANKNKELLELSLGDLERDYIELKTLVSYIKELALLDKDIGVVNCGSGHARPLVEIVENFAKEHGQKTCIKLDYPIKNYEAKSFYANMSKLKNYLDV